MIVSVGLTNKKHSRFVIVKNIYGFSYTLAETKNKPAAFFQAWPEVAIKFDVWFGPVPMGSFSISICILWFFSVWNHESEKHEFGAHFWKYIFWKTFFPRRFGANWNKMNHFEVYWSKPNHVEANWRKLNYFEAYWSIYGVYTYIVQTMHSPHQTNQRSI